MKQKVDAHRIIRNIVVKDDDKSKEIKAAVDEIDEIK